MDQTKEIRALYLKGITSGDRSYIELTSSIGQRNTANEYVIVAKKGDVFFATMTATGWHLIINDHIVKMTLYDGTIPLSQGKVRNSKY